ncbi:MAG: SprT family zinc-dependent metalloprotease [Pseudomonadota bacterium]
MPKPKRIPSWLYNFYDKGAAKPAGCGSISPEGGLSAMSLRALLYRRPSEPQSIQVVFDQAIYLVRVRRHRQARRYTLRIQAASREVILTMPPRGSLKEAKEFAQKHGGWIAARLCRLPVAAPFADGAVVPLRGAPHRVVHRPGVRGTVWTEVAENGEALLCVAGQAPHIERRVSDYLRREAHRDLEVASHRAAEQLGVTVKRISVRDQSSRWGSCSTTGVLSYSWRLILAPPFVLDYLAIHEVAHLVEMNHSPRFWRLVINLCPDANRAKTWLDVHGNDLHRYGVADEAAIPPAPVPA